MSRLKCGEARRVYMYRSTIRVYYSQSRVSLISSQSSWQCDVVSGALTVDLEQEVRLQIFQVLQLCGTGPASTPEVKKHAQSAMRIS